MPSFSMSEQDHKVLRWFRRHDFGRNWTIDCDFKLRHKVSFDDGRAFHRGRSDALG